MMVAPRRVCLTITTRGNYGKLKSVTEALVRSPYLEPFVVVGGGALLERYGGVIELVRANYAAPVSWELPYLVEGETPLAMAKSAALAAVEFSTMLHQAQPDVVLVLADRYECLPMAMAATYLNIPVAHIEGGEVTGSVDESIRHAITKLAHFHFPATEDAARRIVALGEEKACIEVVGSTSLDVIAKLDLEDLRPVVEAQGSGGMGPVVSLEGPYLVVIQHAVTTEFDEARRQAEATLGAIRDIQLPTIWIVGNMDAGNNAIFGAVQHFLHSEHPNYLHLFSALPIERYAPLLKNAACLVGNSSSGIRESLFLGTPTVNIGNRQAGRERGANVLDVAHDRAAIVAAIRQQLAHGPYPADFRFGDGKAAERIAKRLESVAFRLQKRITF